MALHAAGLADQVRRHRAVLRLSWLLLVASVALSTLLQVAVAPPTLVGCLTAGATPVWLLGSSAVLSLLYRTPAPTDPAAEVEDREPAGGEPSKRDRARAAHAAMVAAGQPVTGARLAEAAATATRTRGPPVGRRPRLCAPSTASSPADRSSRAVARQLFKLLERHDRPAVQVLPA